MLIFCEKISAVAGLLTLGLFFEHVSANIREKRFLIFPQTSPTRIQIIVGIGVPVDLEFESVTIGWVFKMEYYLPENASNYLNIIADPFDITPRPIGSHYELNRRSLNGPSDVMFDGASPIEAPAAGNTLDKHFTQSPNSTTNTSGFDSVLNQKFERYEVPVVEVESGTDVPSSTSQAQASSYADGVPEWNEAEADTNGDNHKNHNEDTDWMHEPQNLDISRWIAYKSIATLASSKGLNGRVCVLRSICESARTTFDYTNGILGELMHIIMAPSLTYDELSNHSDNEYLRAEELGQNGAPCDKIFKECTMSILDQFTNIYAPMMDLMNMMG